MLSTSETHLQGLCTRTEWYNVKIVHRLPHGIKVLWHKEISISWQFLDWHHLFSIATKDII